MASNNNDLNLLLKAKVVKLKVELDYKGSNLPSQVNDISKFLKDKPVKLKVELSATVSDLNKQLSTISKTITESKSFKPMRFTVEMDVKGSADKIKKQLKEVMDVVKEFNTQYGEQIKKMKQVQTDAQKVAEQAKNNQNLNIPTNATVQNYNNIKNYVKQLEEAERILKSKLPNGESGLFSSFQMKDAKGNLQGFIATLERANGIVEKVRYSWNAEKNQFQIIDRSTADNVEKQVHRSMQALQNLEREIGKTGQQTRQFQQQYNSLMNAGANHSLTMDMVKAFETQIKNAQAEIQAQSKINDLAREEARIRRDIANITKGVDPNSRQGSTLIANARNLMMDARLANQNQDAEAIKNVRVALGDLTDQAKKYKAEVKDINTATQQRTKLQQQLIELIRSSGDAEVKSGARAVQQLLQRARTTKQVSDAQKQYNDLISRQNMLNSRDERGQALQKLKAVMLDFARQTGKDPDLIMARYRLMEENIGKDIGAINQKIATYQRIIRNAANDRAYAQIQQQWNSIVRNVDHNHIKALISQGDITAIKEYLAQTQKLNIATARVSTNSSGVTKITTQLESTGKTAKQVTFEIDNLSNKLRRLPDSMVFNRNANLGIFEQLRIAMARVPVWMASMTAFYGSLRTLREMSQQIIDVDTQLTELRRVANGNINIDTIFKGAVETAKELGNNVHDVMETMNEFARTYGDFNERQLLAITNTATLMANVSDLSASEAGSNLVGTMNAFNISAEDSIHIVDSLNQVDNNFAISTKQLAEGLSKSASTAKTFGASMEDVTGYITAIGAVTMESGNIIGNSLKTIFSRITTVKGAKDALEGVGVAIADIGKNGEETVKPVNTILSTLASKWDSLSASQQQNIAVNVAGRYQLSRFLALMNNWQTAIDATKTAYNSQGSAMRENEKYLQSFQARINQLKTGFTELSLSVGKAFLSDGLMLGITTLKDLAGVAVEVVNKVGALPVVFGALGVALFKMGVFDKFKASVAGAMTAFGQFSRLVAEKGWSNAVSTSMNEMRNAEEGARTASVALTQAKEAERVASEQLISAQQAEQVAIAEVARAKEQLAMAERQLAGATEQQAIATAEASVANARLAVTQAEATLATQAEARAMAQSALSVQSTNVAMMEASAGARAFGLSLKGALIGTGIGIAFVAVGSAIEWLIHKFNEQKQAEEEVKKVNDDMIKSFHEHGNSYDDLISKYDKLNEKFRENKDAMSPQEVTDYTNATNELAKALPNAVDYVDANGQAHLKSADAIRQEAENVERLAKAQAVQTQHNMTKDIKDQTKAWEDQKSSLKELIKQRDDYVKNNDTSGKKYTLHTLDGDVQYDHNYTKEIDDLNVKIARGQSAMTDAIQKTIKNIQNQSQAYLESKGILKDLGDAQQRVIDDFSQNNHALLEGAQNAKDYNKAQKDLIDGGNKIGETFSDAFNKMTAGITDPRKIQEVKDQLKGISTALPKDFLTLDPSTGKNIDTIVGNLQKVLDVANQIKGGSTDFNGLEKSLENAGMSSKDATGYVANLSKSLGNAELRAKAMSQATDGTTDSIQQLTDATIQAIDPMEELFGISNDDMKAMQTHIQTLQIMQQEYGKNADKTEAWGTAISDLSDYLGVSQNEIAKNLTYYGKVIDAMSSLKIKTDDNGRSILDFSDVKKSEIGVIQDAIKKMGGEKSILDILTGKYKDNTKATQDNAKAKQDNAKKTNDNAKSAQNAKKKVDDLNVSIKETNGVPVGKIKNLFDPLGQNADKTKQKVSNLKDTIVRVKPPDGKLRYLFDPLGQSADTNREKVKKLDTDTGKVGGVPMGKLKNLYNPVGQSADTNKTKVNNLKSAVEGVKVPMGKLNNLFNPVGKSADTSKKKVDDLSTAVSNVKVPEGKWRNLYQDAGQSADNTQSKIDALTQAIKKASSATQVLNDLNSDVGNSLTQAGYLVGKLKEVADGMDNVSNKTGSLDKIKSDVAGIAGGIVTAQGQVAGLFGSFASNVSNLAPVIDAIKSSVIKIGSASIDASSHVNGLVGSMKSLASIDFGKVDGLGVTYSQLASSIYLCMQAVIQSFKNYEGSLSEIEHDTAVKLGQVVVDFDTASKQVQQKVTDMSNAMKKAFKDGTSSIVSQAGNLPSAIGDAIRKNMADASGAIEALAQDMVSRFKKELGIHSPSRVFTELGGWVVKGLVNGLTGEDLKSLGKSVFDDFGGGVFDSWDMIKSYLSGDAIGGAGSEAVKGWLMSAIGATGVDPSWLQPLMTMAMKESGGNPRSINLWDSNAKAGHPSKGLMQTIDSTFNQYAMSGHNDIWNPVDNAIASIRYILDRYGSIWNTPGMRSMAKGGAYKGYANGGIIDKMELAWHGEEGAEAIIPLIPKRRDRGIELWEEAGLKLGIDPQTIEWLKANAKKKTSGVAFGGGASFGAMSGDGGGVATGGGDSGTSGQLQPQRPSYIGGIDLDGNYLMTASSTDLAQAYTTNTYQNSQASYSTQISVLQTQQQAMNKASVQYRDILKQIIALENLRQKSMAQELKSLQTRNGVIERSLAKLPALNKQASWQRDLYNSLHQELDNNNQRIQELQTTMASAVNDIHNQSVELFTNFVDEIVGKYTDAMNGIQAKADTVDFKINVMQLTNPDDTKGLLNLQAEKANDLQQKQATAYNKQNDLQSQYNSAVKQYGAGSDQAKYVKDQLDQATKDYQDATLAVLQAEKDLKDTRAKIADDSINQLKDYYKNMESMATDAIDKEKADLQKAHDAKMKMYDDETQAINDLYDAKAKQLDQAQADEDYQTQLAEKTKVVADLQNKMALLSRDNSLEGKKNRADLQAQLDSANKDLADLQKQHANDQAKQALDAQKQAQLDAIKTQQDAENNSFQTQSDALDAQKEAVTKQYEDLINNDKKWADMRNEAIKGNFSTIQTELQKMTDNINKMNKGIFDGLVEGFSTFSDAVKKQVADANNTTVSNMSYDSQTPVNEVAQASSANPYTVTDGVVNTSVGTKIPTPNETTPPKTSTSNSSSSSKGVIEITKDVWLHKTPDTNSSSRVKMLHAGDRFKYYGVTKAMYNVGSGYIDMYYAKVVSGSTSSSPSQSSSSSSSSHGWETTTALNLRASASTSGKVLEVMPKGAKVEYLGMENGWAKVKYNGKIGYAGKSYLKQFDTGGYTGDWIGGGRLAILDQKEQVLNKDDTKNLFDTIKLVDKIKQYIPNITQPNLQGKLATMAGHINTTITYGDINVKIENGDKKSATNIAKEILIEMKKKGR
jgi:TP901 family phage tail tape measure protein